MIAVEILATTLAVIIGLFVLRVIQKALEDRAGASKLSAGLEFLLGP